MIRLVRRFTLLIFISACHSMIFAQELEPRVYGNIPKGTNVFAILYGVSKGNVLTDPTLPIQDFKITAHNIGAAYVRTFALADKLARIQISAPFIKMNGDLKLNGRDTTGTRTGFGDIRIRFGINIIGSKALTPREFATYQQKTIVGVSIITSVPTGLYYADKRINLGSNRWGFKPEVGISRRFKHVYAEAYAGVWFYSQNKEFLTSKTLVQKPVASFQMHINYYLNRKIWFGINGNWFNGGETLIDDVASGSLKNNWRIGSTFAYAFNAFHSIKFQFHVGAFTNVGYDYNIAVLGYQYAFFRKQRKK